MITVAIMRPAWGLLALALLSTTLLVLPRVQVPGVTILAQSLQNLLHLPLFMLLAHLAWRLAQPLALPQRRALWLLVMLALAAGSEWAQQWTGRSSSLSDLARNLAGVAAWAGAHAAINSHGGRRWSGALVAVLLLGWGGFDFARTALHYLQRNAAAPLVFAPDVAFSRFFTRTNGRVSWSATAVTAAPRNDGWSIIIDEPLPDWHAYRALCMDWSGNGVLQATLRVHDWLHNQQYDDRFNRHYPAFSGRRVETVDITAIREGPRHRTLQVESVAGLVVFGAGPSGGRLLLHRLWLTSGSCAQVNDAQL